MPLANRLATKFFCRSPTPDTASFHHPRFFSDYAGHRPPQCQCGGEDSAKKEDHRIPTRSSGNSEPQETRSLGLRVLQGDPSIQWRPPAPPRLKVKLKLPVARENFLGGSASALSQRGEKSLFPARIVDGPEDLRFVSVGELCGPDIAIAFVMRDV